MPLDPLFIFDRIAKALGTKSVEKISDKLGISKQSVYLWRRGKLPGIDNLVEIADSTGASMHWLLTGEGPERVIAVETSKKEALPAGLVSEQTIEDLHALIADEIAEQYEQIARELRARKLKRKRS
jgi:transcriptional regulator with XRE-family HTH domain